MRLAVLAAAALAAVCLAACRGDQHGFAPPPPVVEVFTVVPETVRDTVVLVGQLESESSVELRPEIDGVVETIDFTEGQSVKKGDVLFHLRDAEQRAHAREAKARAKLAEEIFRRISLLAEKEVSARIEFDKASAPSRARKLQPGLFANLEVQLAERENALVVPDAALMVDQAGSFVWRVGADGKATRAPIEVGLRKAARVEIASGLEAGDKIVS